jgi:hypothetical protein
MTFRPCPMLRALHVIINASDAPLASVYADGPQHTGGNCWALLLNDGDDDSPLFVVTHGMIGDGYEIGRYASLASWNDGGGEDADVADDLSLAAVLRLLGATNWSDWSGWQWSDPRGRMASALLLATGGEMDARRAFRVSDSLTRSGMLWHYDDDPVDCLSEFGPDVGTMGAAVADALWCLAGDVHLHALAAFHVANHDTYHPTSSFADTFHLGA